MHLPVAGNLPPSAFTRLDESPDELFYAAPRFVTHIMRAGRVRPEETVMISADQLGALMAGSTPHAVLDIRERAAFQKGQIFRATSLPRRLLELRLPALVTCRQTPIVLYDEDGALSALAAPTLREMGYTDVRILSHGLGGWRNAGRPTVQGVNTPSKVFGERVLHDFRTPEITPRELDERIAAGDDMVIVDTRTPEEYARGCLPGAWSVPGGELVLRIADLIERPETTIVVHCGGRTRSYLGAESVRRMGLPNPVVALKNGTMGWDLAGLELERGASRWAPSPSATSRARAAKIAERVAADEKVPFVSPDELEHLWERRDRENVYILDVRTSQEYTDEHIAGAIWAPGGQAVQATDEYVAVHTAVIVLACDGVARSVMTAAWLRRMGFPNVMALAGGLPAWKQSGGAVETGLPTPVPWGYETARSVVRTVTPRALGNALILDVDTSDAYSRGHVPGAGWLCRSRLELKITEVASDKRHAIVVTCADGVQSTLGAVTLGRLGYSAVRVLASGTRGWERAGLPIESGPTRLLDEPDDVVLKPYDKGRASMEAYLRWEEALDGEGHSPYALIP
jgi:rhodanese-related sulfurtransferase